MKTIGLIFLAAFCFGAEKKDMYVNLDDIMTSDEWNGPQAFIDSAKTEKVEICRYIERTESVHGKTDFILTRLFMVAAKTNCSQRMVLISKYLESTAASRQAGAIILASSLSPAQRAPFRETIKKIRSTSKNIEVRDALEKHPDK